MRIGHGPRSSAAPPAGEAERTWRNPSGSAPPDPFPAEDPIATPHDKFFRRIYGVPANAVALLRAVLPPRVVAALAWDSLVECSGLLVDAGLEKREADLLFAARRLDVRGTVHLLVEHLSSQQRRAVVRLRGYAQRLCEKSLAADDAPGSVPTIVPIVVYHGETGWSMPTRLADLRDAALPGAPADDFAMLVIDLGSRTEGEVVALGMPPIPTLAWLYLRTVRACTPAMLEAALLRWQPLLAAASPPGGDAPLQVHFQEFETREARMQRARGFRLVAAAERR